MRLAPVSFGVNKCPNCQTVLKEGAEVASKLVDAAGRPLERAVERPKFTINPAYKTPAQERADIEFDNWCNENIDHPDLFRYGPR